jgi:hypothetical protein
MYRKENYKKKLNIESNGAMYKKFKLKNTNWIVMFSFCKSPSSLSKGITWSIFHWFQQCFVPLDEPRKELQSLCECQKQWSNIQRVWTQKHKLNCYVQFLQITLFTFKGHNLFISSSISTLFVPSDELSGELQNIFEA